MDPNMVGRAAFAFTVLLGALGLVTWRQSRALEALGSLDDIRRELSVGEAEQVELERTIQVLESRARVVPAARERLGMHTPKGSEFVILPGATP
jgi:cell division protein FtsL